MIIESGPIFYSLMCIILSDDKHLVFPFVCLFFCLFLFCSFFVLSIPVWSCLFVHSFVLSVVRSFLCSFVPLFVSKLVNTR